MKLSLLTYNVLYNNAFPYLGQIISKYRPDIICLQEVDTDEANSPQMQKLNYQLADYSNSFIRFDKIFGVATFYNIKTCSFIDSTQFRLPRSIYETVLFIVRFLKGGNEPRTVLKTYFRLKGSKITITVYNTHLGVIESNQSRVKRMQKIIDFVENDKDSPTVIAGDLNYHPYARKRLEDLMNSHNFFEATYNLDYTMKLTPSGEFEKLNIIQKILSKTTQLLLGDKYKLDYVFYKNIKLISTKRIESNLSDHYPIIVKMEI